MQGSLIEAKMNQNEIEQLKIDFLYRPNPQNSVPNAVAKEIEQLREQQETIWWTDKQYEWMRKGQGEDSDLDIVRLHIEHGNMIENDKKNNYSETKKEDPIGMIIFLIIVFSVVFTLAS